MYKFKVKMWKYTNNYVLKDIRNKYKERLNDYINVYIYETNEEMYKEVSKLEKEEVGTDYQGRTLSFTRIYEDEEGNIVKLGKICGNMYFSIEDLSSYVVNHECVHAVLGYIDRRIEEKLEIFSKYKDYRFVKENNLEIEELFCYMVGGISSQINEFISKNIVDKYYEPKENK